MGSNVTCGKPRMLGVPATAASRISSEGPMPCCSGCLHRGLACIVRGPGSSGLGPRPRGARGCSEAARRESACPEGLAGGAQGRRRWLQTGSEVSEQTGRVSCPPGIWSSVSGAARAVRGLAAVYRGRRRPLRNLASWSCLGWPFVGGITCFPRGRGRPEVQAKVWGLILGLSESSAAQTGVGLSHKLRTVRCPFLMHFKGRWALTLLRVLWHP